MRRSICLANCVFSSLTILKTCHCQEELFAGQASLCFLLSSTISSLSITSGFVTLEYIPSTWNTPCLLPQPLCVAEISGQGCPFLLPHAQHSAAALQSAHWVCWPAWSFTERSPCWVSRITTAGKLLPRGAHFFAAEVPAMGKEFSMDCEVASTQQNCCPISKSKACISVQRKLRT